jgi:hypothetical protein
MFQSLPSRCHVRGGLARIKVALEGALEVARTTHQLKGIALDLWLAWCNVEKSFDARYAVAEARGENVTSLDLEFELAHSTFWKTLGNTLMLDFDDGCWSIDASFGALKVIHLVYCKDADEMEGLDDAARSFDQEDDDDEGLLPLGGSYGSGLKLCA